MTGIELIIQERKEQIEKHGHTPMHDAKSNTNGELLSAIMLIVSNLALHDQGIGLPKDAFEDLRPDTWDENFCIKLVSKSTIDQLKTLGAFAAAEIDRRKFLEK